MRKLMIWVILFLSILGILASASILERRVYASQGREAEKLKAERLIRETEEILDSLGEPKIVRLKEIFENPEVFEGKRIVIPGNFLGWQTEKAVHPEITRSDWAFQDLEGKEIYVTGQSPLNYDPQQDRGEPLTIYAKVRVTEKGVPYLEAEEIKKYTPLSLLVNWFFKVAPELSTKERVSLTESLGERKISLKGRLGEITLTCRVTYSLPVKRPSFITAELSTIFEMVGPSVLYILPLSRYLGKSHNIGKEIGVKGILNIHFTEVERRDNIILGFKNFLKVIEFEFLTGE
jgi:hypothetical protein